MTPKARRPTPISTMSKGEATNYKDNAQQQAPLDLRIKFRLGVAACQLNPASALLSHGVQDRSAKAPRTGKDLDMQMDETTHLIKSEMAPCTVEQMRQLTH